MAYRDETDRPEGRPSMRVVQDSSGSGAWFIAGAVVIALVIAAFVILSSGDPATVPVSGDVNVDVIPQVSESAPAASEGIEATPNADAALPPATEPETVPQTNSAN